MQIVVLRTEDKTKHGHGETAVELAENHVDAWHLLQKTETPDHLPYLLITHCCFLLHQGDADVNTVIATISLCDLDVFKTVNTVSVDYFCVFKVALSAHDRVSALDSSRLSFEHCRFCGTLWRFMKTIIPRSDRSNRESTLCLIVTTRIVCSVFYN